MVSAYLDVAEINALDRHAMTMQDWVNELDLFLKMTRKDIMNHPAAEQTGYHKVLQHQV